MDQAADKKNDIKNCVTRYVVPSSVHFKINDRLRLLAQSNVSACASEKREISSGWDTLYIHVSATMNGYVI